MVCMPLSRARQTFTGKVACRFITKLARFITILLFALVVVSHAAALEVKSLHKGEASPKANIEQLDWLTGYWQGKGLGGLSEEFIGPARQGQMPGMFRQTKANGELMFYEFYLFDEVDGSLVLRIKHFSPELEGWEAKNEYEEFALVEISENAVYFDGISYAAENDQLKSSVRVSGGDGDEKIVSFSFVRKPL